MVRARIDEIIEHYNRKLQDRNFSAVNYFCFNGEGPKLYHFYYQLQKSSPYGELEFGMGLEIDPRVFDYDERSYTISRALSISRMQDFVMRKGLFDPNNCHFSIDALYLPHNNEEGHSQCEWSIFDISADSSGQIEFRHEYGESNPLRDKYNDEISRLGEGSRFVDAIDLGFRIYDEFPKS